jgi:preprotein translocase subunit YajC
MLESRMLLALAGPQRAGEPNPMASLLLMGVIFAIFYFILIMPMRSKQKKLEQQIRAMKTGDRVIINPGIFGVIVAVEDDAFQVRIDDKTRIKVLKSAIAGLQGSTDTEKK